MPKPCAQTSGKHERSASLKYSFGCVSAVFIASAHAFIRRFAGIGHGGGLHLDSVQAAAAFLIMEFTGNNAAFNALMTGLWMAHGYPSFQKWDYVEKGNAAVPRAQDCPGRNARCVRGAASGESPAGRAGCGLRCESGEPLSDESVRPPARKYAGKSWHIEKPLRRDLIFPRGLWYNAVKLKCAGKETAACMCIIAKNVRRTA